MRKHFTVFLTFLLLFSAFSFADDPDSDKPEIVIPPLFPIYGIIELPELPFPGLMHSEEPEIIQIETRVQPALPSREPEPLRQTQVSNANSSPVIRPAEPELPPQTGHLVPPQPAIPPVSPLPALPPANPVPELTARVIPETADEEIVFSRVVRMNVGQMLEIPFRGTGWVYLGELGNRRGLSYDSRRLDLANPGGVAAGQSFIFHAESAGTYILGFYMQDFIHNYIINDHVQVIVASASENTVITQGGSLAERSRVIAEPRWPPLADSAPAVEAVQSRPSEPAAAAQAAPAPANNNSNVPATPPQTASAIDPYRDDTPADYVRRARLEFDSGRVEQALSILDTMRQRYPLGSDEAWLLYGQLLEANSGSRDIRLALEYYRRLVSEYPQSRLAGNAQQRIAYLERFYINIR